MLDGADDYFDFPDSDDWEPGPNYAFSAWIRPAVVTGGFRYIAGRQTTATPTGWVLTQNSAAISLYLSFNNGTWTGLITGGTLVANTWQHVAWKKVGNDYSLWLGGAQVGGTYTNSGTCPNATTALRFGSHTGTTLEFNGHMDDVRIYKGADVPISHLMKQSRIN